MTAFWISGIAINLLFFGLLVRWAVKSWRQSDRARADAHASSRTDHASAPADQRRDDA